MITGTLLPQRFIMPNDEAVQSVGGPSGNGHPIDADIPLPEGRDQARVESWGPTTDHDWADRRAITEGLEEGTMLVCRMPVFLIQA